MPNDTPESRMHQITPFTKCFSTTKPPSNLMYRNAFNSLKNIPLMFFGTSTLAGLLIKKTKIIINKHNI